MLLDLSITLLLFSLLVSAQESICGKTGLTALNMESKIMVDLPDTNPTKNTLEITFNPCAKIARNDRLEVDQCIANNRFCMIFSNIKESVSKIERVSSFRFVNFQ
jgi:hypothetical protein